MNCIKRLLAEVPYRPNGTNRSRWIDDAEQENQGKSYNHALEIPEGTYTLSPGSIATALKMNSRDFDQAMSRLNFYINRQGENLSDADWRRLQLAKQALYRTYGKEVPDATPEKK